MPVLVAWLEWEPCRKQTWLWALGDVEMIFLVGAGVRASHHQLHPRCIHLPVSLLVSFEGLQDRGEPSPVGLLHFVCK